MWWDRDRSGTNGMVIPRFVDQALAGGPVVVYDDGEQIRCFAHVREVVEAVSRLMETPAAVGRVFNIGRPRRPRLWAETPVTRDPALTEFLANCGSTAGRFRY